MEKILVQFGQDLARAQYSQQTRVGYCARINELVSRVGKPIVEINRDELRGFVDAVMASDKADSEKRKVIWALLFLYRRTLGQPAMVSFIKMPRRYSPLPVVLAKSEVHRLLNAIHNPRYQAVAMVMYGAGLRVAEALSLTSADIDRGRGVITVRCGKGGKPREAKLSPVLYDWLRAYWSRTRPPLPYLFADFKGRLPRANTIRMALAQAAAEAGIKKRVFPHVLRSVST